jgi:heme exporter protein B
MNTSAWSQVRVLIWKDLLIDLRRKENLIAMFFFALLTLLIFSFALNAADEPRYKVTQRVLGALSGAGVGAPAVQASATLQGRTYYTQGELLAALEQATKTPLALPDKLAVLKHAQQGPLEDSMPGLLWVTFVLAGVLGLGKAFGQEKENGCMDGLLLTPLPRGLLYLGKMASTTLFLLVMLALLLPLCGLLFQVNLAGIWLPLAGVLLAGAIGFSSLGTLLGGITSSLRGKEVLLPILLFPLLVPLLLVVVHLTTAILTGEPLADQTGWLQLLAAFDAIFLIVSYLVFEFVMEA